MSQSLGSLFVDLIAETGRFTEPMQKAAYIAQRTAQDISKGFRELQHVAEQTFGAFGELNPIVSQVSFVMSNAAKAASGAMKEFGHLGGNIGAIASLGAGTTVGLLSLEGVLVGLTIHTAEAVTQMGLMAEKSGVSIEEFSGLAFAAKMSGVSVETLEGGLGKLSKSIFAAATAAPHAETVFKRMHISLRDSNHEIRQTGDVLLDIAKKFATMPDNIKPALAKQLFGKSGTEMIPFLNQGPDAIKGFIETAKKLNIILDDQSFESAHKFEQSLHLIEAAATGVSYHLMRELLPSLQAVVTKLEADLPNKASGLNLFIDLIVKATKLTLTLGDTYATFAGSVGRTGKAWIAETKEFYHGIAKMLSHSDDSSFLGELRNTRAKQKAIDEQFFNDNKKAWQANDDFIQNIYGPMVPTDTKYKPPLKKTKDDTDTDVKDKEDSVLKRIKESIDALEREAEKWLKVGQAGSQAEQLIAKAQEAGTAEYNKRRDMAEKEKNPETRAAALKFVDDNKEFIERQAATKSFGEDIAKVTEELDKQSEKMQQEAASTEELAAAYNFGGVAAALINVHFADQIAKLSVLKEMHDRMSAKLGEENPEVQQLAEGLALASEKLDADKISYAAKMHDELRVEINKTSRELSGEIPLLAKLGDAYFEGTEAVRRATVALELYHWEQAHPFANDNDKIGQKAILESQSVTQENLRISQEAAHYSLSALRKKELGDLENIKAALVEEGQSTLLVNAQIYDSERKLIEMWDTAAIKYGTFSQKFRAVMNQVVLEGENFGEKLFQSIGKAIDDLSTKLAQFVVTGKANFKEILQSFETSIAKASFQKLFSTVASKILPGIGGKRDGSSPSSALYVVMEGIGGLASPGRFGASGLDNLPLTKDSGGDSTSAFSSMFSKVKDMFSSVIGSIGSVIGSIGSGIGKLFSSFGSIFGGFLASGGDVTPGKAYVVGEKHPEFFVPRQPGHVAPSLQTGSHHTSIVQMHIHGVTDFDSFRRSQGQIMSGLQRQIAIAHSRNG